MGPKVREVIPKHSFFERYALDHTHPLNHLCHYIGIPLIVIALPLLFFKFWVAIGLFVLGWVFQFIGHAIEGKPPSFFKDPRMLIVGPIYFVSKLFRGSKSIERADR